MKVSVIVLTFNRAQLVTETIDSILNQTFGDFELIVVDNESLDNTEEIIGSYTDERIRYFRNQNNGVLAVNRNYGIRVANGEYVAFCDDDDIWMPEKLEKEVLEIEKDSQIGLVCTNAVNFDTEGEHGNRIKDHPGDKYFTFESLIWGNRVIGSTALARKDVIEAVGMLDEDPLISPSDDYELWLRIAKRYRIKYIDQPLIKFRIYFRICSNDRESHLKVHMKSPISLIDRQKRIYNGLVQKGILDSYLYNRRIRHYDKITTKIIKHKWIKPLATRAAKSIRVIKRIRRMF